MCVDRYYSLVGMGTTDPKLVTYCYCIPNDVSSVMISGDAPASDVGAAGVCCGGASELDRSDTWRSSLSISRDDDDS